MRDGIEGIGMFGHSDLHQEPSKCFGSKLGVFTHQPPEKSKVLASSTMTGPSHGTATSRAKHSGYEMTGDMGWRPAGMLGVLGVANSTFRIPDGFHFEVPQDHEIDFELRFRPSGIDKPFTATLDAELVFLISKQAGPCI